MTFEIIHEQAPLYSFLLIAVLGLLVGSFLNVVIYRLPKMMERDWDKECWAYIESSKTFKNVKVPKATESEEPFNLAVPNSKCPSCQAPIKAWQNIPVISYILLKGKCNSCSNPISIRYPIVEATTAALSVLILYYFGASLATLFGLFFLWCLIALTMIDVDHHLLPDSITLPLLWLGLMVNTQGIYTDINSAIYGAAGGYLSLWSVYWAFKLLTGKEGMGYGDFKLLAALGAWMGWKYLFLILILSSLVGAVLGVLGILILGREKSQPLPFGPYLAGAGLIAFIWGDVILAQYLQIASPT